MKERLGSHRGHDNESPKKMGDVILCKVSVMSRYVLKYEIRKLNTDDIKKMHEQEDKWMTMTITATLPASFTCRHSQLDNKYNNSD